MSGTKKTLVLDQYEYGVIFHSLNDRRNRMLEENKATDAVDDVLLKVIETMNSSKKKKKENKNHEDR